MPRKKWSLHAASVELQCDRSALSRWIDETGLQPVEVKERTNGDILMYHMVDLAGLVFSMRRPSSGDDESARGPLYDQQVIKLRRENEMESGKLGNRRSFIQAGQPIMMRLSNDLSRLGEIASDAGADLDPKQIENINEHFVKYKNELAGLADKLLTVGTQ